MLHDVALITKTNFYLADSGLGRSASFILFTVVLFVTRNLVWASYMGICALITLVFVSLLAILERPIACASNLQTSKIAFLYGAGLLALFYNRFFCQSFMKARFLQQSVVLLNALISAHTTLMISYTHLQADSSSKLASLLETSQFIIPLIRNALA